MNLNKYLERLYNERYVDFFPLNTPESEADPLSIELQFANSEPTEKVSIPGKYYKKISDNKFEIVITQQVAAALRKLLRGPATDYLKLDKETIHDINLDIHKKIGSKIKVHPSIEMKIDFDNKRVYFQ